MPDSPPLDAAVLEALRELNEPGQPDVLGEVLNVFLADTPGRLEAIAAAVSTRDGHALQRAAHALKGASAAIGAHALHEASRQLEDVGKSLQFDRAGDRLTALTDEYRRVAAAIRQLL